MKNGIYVIHPHETVTYTDSNEVQWLLESQGDQSKLLCIGVSIPDKQLRVWFDILGHDVVDFVIELFGRRVLNILGHGTVNVPQPIALPRITCIDKVLHTISTEYLHGHITQCVMSGPILLHSKSHANCAKHIQVYLRIRAFILVFILKELEELQTEEATVFSKGCNSNWLKLFIIKRQL